MAKNIKLNIKNTQLAAALQLTKPKASPPAPAPVVKTPAAAAAAPVEKVLPAPAAPKVEKPTAPPTATVPPRKPLSTLVKAAPASGFQRRDTRPTQARPPLRAGQTRPLPPRTAPTAAKTSPSTTTTAPAEREEALKKKPSEFKEFRDFKAQRRSQETFDARDRQGLRDLENQEWRKKRSHKAKIQTQEEIIRPKALSVRLPVMVKDLAQEMKLKASQLIATLFRQGVMITLNDLLADETTVQLLGHEFDCVITIDTSEEKRVQITDKSIKQEIASEPSEELKLRPPVVTFMGHVDHGKTSLIDTIRKSNVASGEAGAITQHIGAFTCHTAVGNITILDTPGHEAFSAMRERGAEVTDIVVLVIAGDEGMRAQTIEALQQAREANVPIVVAINKMDKPNFNAENIYRELSEHNLLPEVWGGTTITVNCSAVSGKGIPELLEMLALQAEVLELKANPSTRSRGTVIESQMHKGRGCVATVLVQNGTLRLGDAIVFDQEFARVKTMHDDQGKPLHEAPPSTPVKITGLSGLPSAGSEFIAVKDEREAREVSEKRKEGQRTSLLAASKGTSLEGLLQKHAEVAKKTLNLLLVADVQGSLEALKTSLGKILSEKVELNFLFSHVGEISESDIERAAASKATIVGFHTSVESRADDLIRDSKVNVRLHDIIYHAVDDVKEIMLSLLDKIAQETDAGKAEIKALFKASQLGIIAGCQVLDGTIRRNQHIRVLRGKEVIWKGPIASLKRVKEDVREVSKGQECGILLQNFQEVQVGDILQAFDVTYLQQTL